MFLVNCIGSGPWVQGCGNVCIPTEVAKITSLIYNAIKVIVPIALVFIGMFDMAKAVTTKSEDEVKKAQRLLTQKAIAAALVFVLFSGITWMLSILDETSGNANKERSVASCLNVLFDYDGSGAGSHGVYNRSTYTTVADDTLTRIASRYNTTASAIRNANPSIAGKGDNEALTAGIELTIPTAQGYTDADSICQSNGYTKSLRIVIAQARTEDGVVKYFYANEDGTQFSYIVCADYNRADATCNATDAANGDKYTFSNGNQYCVMNFPGTHYSVVYTEGHPDTVRHAKCGAQSSAEACSSCCGTDSTGYLLANQDINYANNNFCLCVKRK